MSLEDKIPSVVFVTRKWPPSVGGMETYSKRLSEELGKLTRTEVIFLPGRADGFVKTGGSLLRFGFASALRLLFRSRGDVTHLADMSLWPLAVFAKLGNWRTRLYISAHGTDVAYPRRGGLKAGLYGYYLKLGARLFPNISILANSNATSDAAREFGFDTITVIPLGADISEDPQKNIPLSSHDIFFAGRIIELKGLSWFVNHVLPLLPCEFRLRVAGTIWDKQEAVALEDERVTYLGHLPQNELKEEFRRSLCVVMPNIQTSANNFEGFGLAAIESAAAGGITIASEHGGLTDAINPGETGFLLEPGNHEAWAEKILEIFNWEPDFRSRFIDQSRNAISEEYSWHKVAEKTLNAYLAREL